MRQLKINKQFTIRDSRSFDQYLTDISKIPLLSDDEEVRLVQQMKLGDVVAKERLITSNLRFVVSVSKQYQNQGLTLGELVNEGNLGLIKAAAKFDETRGFKFISYAVWWIRQSILQALADQSRMIRIPLNKVGGKSKLAQAEERLQQELSRDPTDEELQSKSGMSEKDYDQLILLKHDRVLSLEYPLGYSEELTLIDILDVGGKNTDSVLDEESLERQLRMSLEILNSDERLVLVNYYGIGDLPALGLEDIAEKIGKTRERIRQIKEKALRRLRKNKQIAKGLTPYL